ncbi:hypothetical protein MsAc7_17810 [Methanolapillus millepedarum]|uniref:Terminase small subunit n=2 Tax=Methanolapillus millepedarum TaxID=3028296 RepID=A0AA96V6S5_9EURY|nr:hypothetical protein MsAc7_17810 [Methanosarcinaceae archaeon Ac7]
MANVGEKITEKQKKFAEYYVKDGNATQAYKMAGYRSKNDQTAGSCAAKLLKKPLILHEIDKIRQEIRKNRIATAIELQEFWTEKMKYAEDPRDQLKASELLAKALGMFRDNEPHASPPIIVIDVGNMKE